MQIADTSADREFVRARWLHCWNNDKFSDAEVSARWLALIEHAYSDPSRSFHTASHLADLLRRVDKMEILDRRAVHAAIFFHDFVYCTREMAHPWFGTIGYKDNEQCSARVWLQFAHESVCDGASFFTPEWVSLVWQMIADTRAHKLRLLVDPVVVSLSAAPLVRDAGKLYAVETSVAWNSRTQEVYRHDAPCFLDADMGVLGAPPARYSEYRASIAHEFGHMESEAFRHGRSQALRGFLNACNDRGHVFLTEGARTSYEEQALANIRAEIADLERQCSSA